MIKARLVALERRLRGKDARLLVSFKDGRQIAVDAGEAIEIVKEHGGDVVRVEDLRGRNGQLPGLLAALCGEE